MKKAFKILSALFVVLFVFPVKTYAVCPICTVAVAAGLGLSRYLGIDDAVSSIWIGGLILSVSFWTIDWLSKKKVAFKYKNILVFVFWYGLTLIPLQLTGIMGHPFNVILGVDKILFGTAVGSIFFLLGVWADKKVREKRGKQLFAFQRVVFPMVSLAIASLVVYFYGGYLY
ncbi:MAG TPA: hypothetical protein VJ481_01985 [Patescibacteria group bacterium]|uniref:Uncharacterized protein n=1 Tax=Candidatus Woesebacteria bacterium RBG_13_46_13 TaxID=1802479 RepID=A0A1F7X771_9BACT|nr:MAG: hypothetical protein A2Y68_01735 [Candidatus Woesebacteria bacterium RBG_13_46_13]HJX59308.1 hypothetical protein [Patescibacteria group bacterium]